MPRASLLLLLVVGLAAFVGLVSAFVPREQQSAAYESFLPDLERRHHLLRRDVRGNLGSSVNEREDEEELQTSPTN